jgi:hypothetical protein
VSRLLTALVTAAFGVGILAVGPNATQPSRAAGWGYIAVENVLEAHDLGVVRPGPLAWDAAARALVVVDRATGGARLVGPQGRVLGNAARAAAPRVGRLTARDAASGHRYALDTSSGAIIETDRSGAIVSRRSVADLQLRGVAGMAVAPTADTTDATDAVSLYVSVADAVDDGSATGPAVLELALAAPAVSAALAAVPENDGQLVKTIDTSAWNPFSPDPSGIAYVGPLAKLVVSDGEVDEDNINNYPYHGTNVWLADPVTGAADGNMDTTSALPSNKEPVGAAYDPVRDELYLSKDGSSSRVWVYSRDGEDFEQVRTVLLSNFGSGDAEGIAFGNNTLYIADGSNKEVWVIGAGNDGVVATGDDQLLTHFDTASLGLNDPEGIAVHPVTGNLWILSRKDGEGILETTPDGTPVSITNLAFPHDNPGGLELAPSSSTLDDAGVLSAWIVERGEDNNNDPDENDGKIYEVRIQAGGPPPPPPPPGGNLLENGDFEAGPLGSAPAGWTTNPRFTTSNAEVNGGAFSGRHEATDGAGYTVEQRVDVTSGQQYSFDAWANWVGGTDKFSVIIKLQWRTANRALTTVTLAKVNKPSGPGWNEYSVTGLTAPPGATIARVFMKVSSLNTTVYVDDIVFAAEP